ncbi:MAG: ATP-dependent Clp protease adaptor ClpS [Acidobacteria bacterium]|nr:ATP-dependent Clp protease adaptor ClpS [Acidobacteriota bacterium]NIM62715.1 ATP-dependent Clp protease adaptor ClpS [Acidobacteriota bacterium]NIO58332.1 ATP-dependent Clp protease adaptor ClpS [Acidobacteriota bacterium]NIQ29392.1 ATP-dependent Clp protease adaptor ClpS [Acidobacteriota bacterium]NIQ87174.1 ATP-dependent Clp protease adaptor ClpS [Acidobacteriota bacterium]
MADRGTKREGGVLEKTRDQTKRPELYKVLLHNDDYTSMDFVVDILESIFAKSPAEAYRIMMLVHRTGVGVAGIYTHEVAETKVAEVGELAREAGYPLKASLEEE